MHPLIEGGQVARVREFQKECQRPLRTGQALGWGWAEGWSGETPGDGIGWLGSEERDTLLGR